MNYSVTGWIVGLALSYKYKKFNYYFGFKSSLITPKNTTKRYLINIILLTERN